jgi:hypothetical protein
LLIAEILTQENRHFAGEMTVFRKTVISPAK